jgi:hypothetical protein
MTRPISPAAAMFKGASGNTLVGDVYGEEGPPVLLLHGGGQTRHAWKKTGDLIAPDGPRRLRRRSARPWRFRMGAGRRLPVRRLRRRRPRAAPTPWPSAAACGRRWSAPRSAAWPRCSPTASRNAGNAKRRSTSRSGAGRHHAAGRCRGVFEDSGLHARAAPRGFRFDCRSRRRGSRPICRTGRVRARTKA